jgi:hypothetical protein
LEGLGSGSTAIGINISVLTVLDAFFNREAVDSDSAASQITFGLRSRFGRSEIIKNIQINAFRLTKFWCSKCQDKIVAFSDNQGDRQCALPVERDTKTVIYVKEAVGQARWLVGMLVLRSEQLQANFKLP